MTSKLFGLCTGFAIGAVLSIVNFALLVLWNQVLDPLARFLLKAASHGPRGWNGESLHGIDLVPILMAVCIYYVGLPALCRFVLDRWPDRLNVSLTAWSAFAVTTTSTLLMGALLGMIAVVAYQGAGVSLSLVVVVVYAVLFVVLPIIAAFKGARGVLDER
ncbi:MAG: hypothetical protein BWZ07_01940 [Alphaproteobacteria bacterium ADurb.BinA280]|jgi:hypothetical protein|nr:MAG: hypothetical protein BWZ07_01940 [Alphaproteobacteria bacterium ADurb.BinA280]